MSNYYRFKSSISVTVHLIFITKSLQVGDIVDTEQFPVKTPNGVNMPSFIVMDRGLPFDEWVASITPDFALALQVC